MNLEKIENFDFDSFDNEANNFDDGINFDEQADNFLGAGLAYSLLRKRAKRKRANKSAKVLAAKINAQSAIPLKEAIGNVSSNMSATKDYLSKVAPDLPQENYNTPATLSAAVSGVHINRVASKAKEFNIPEDEAETDVLQEDIDNEEIPNDFLGGVLGTALNAGKAFLTKVNAKRSASGKKPLFAGKGWKNLKNTVDKNKDQFENLGQAGNAIIEALKKDNPNIAKEETGVFAGIKAGIGAASDTAKKDFFKDNLPAILIGVAALLIIGYFLNRKK